MENYFNILFSEVNITLTVLLIILILYWLATMISGIDFDLDIDVDVDVDIDADIDLDTGIEGGNMDFQDVANAEVDRQHVVNKRTRKLKWWQIFLIYFNFVGLPFMFTFTFWIFIWWMSSVLTTIITSSYDNSFGYVIVLAAFVPALILTKVITTPFKSFFKNLNKDGDKAVDFLGREALLLSSISGDKLGNAEVMADGNVMSIYVKSLDGSELRFRESVLIIKQSDDKNYFLVSKA
ncbi:OB-fold-containig protein [uncultured Nonlabens sp.]|uniref:OB-fold-containig protein n=1 Tax=uncultured Nonlabens sp. TaxID=859306 RepID=UPI002626CB24|nr:OB-fold-containig protein [uncultured Nonlabens sp.]